MRRCAFLAAGFVASRPARCDGGADERDVLDGLSTLDGEGLRARVSQLVSEMHDRSKWEALRLHEAVRLSQKRAADANVAALQKATLQADLELAVALESQRRDLEHRDAFDAKADEARASERLTELLRQQVRSSLFCCFFGRALLFRQLTPPLRRPRRSRSWRRCEQTPRWRRRRRRWRRRWRRRGRRRRSRRRRRCARTRRRCGSSEA